MRTLLEIGLANAVMATALALLAAGVSAACRRPALTHSLWLLVLLKLLTPPLVAVPLPWPAAAEPVADTADAAPPARDALPPAEPAGDTTAPPAETTAALPEPIDAEEEVAAAPPAGPALPAATPGPRPWQHYALPFWLTTSALWFIWTSWHVCRFRRLLRYAEAAPPELQARADDLARRLGLRRAPTVWLVPGAVSPMLWALGAAPRLLFPAGLLGRLDDEQRATLLAHELAHLRRRDHWVRLVELAATGLYWWHPVVWWARRELHEAEEQCCDAWVVAVLRGAGRAYALALLEAVAFFSHARSALPAAASGIGQVPHLKRRLTMILQGTSPRSLSWAGCLAVFALGLLLPVLPVGAQQPGKDPTKRADPGNADRDRRIEQLSKDLEALEEMKRAEHALRMKEEYAASLEKARANVKKLAEAIEVKRKELKQLEAEHQYMVNLLKTLEEQIATLKDREKATTPKPKPEPKAGDKKAAELEEKLDRLLREVEELRRELRKGKPGGGGGGGFFPGSDSPQPQRK